MDIFKCRQTFCSEEIVIVNGTRHSFRKPLHKGKYLFGFKRQHSEGLNISVSKIGLEGKCTKTIKSISFSAWSKSASLLLKNLNLQRRF